MSQDKMKKAVALEAIKYIEDGMVLGIGTGSTVNFLIDALPSLNKNIKQIVSSSESSSTRLKNLGFEISELNNLDGVDIYIDGADETNPHLQLIKGGGGAHTNEKMIAASSNQFICIVDTSKLVEILGKFPLPVEALSENKESVIQACKKYSQQITSREGLSDNGNILLDLHGIEILEPLKIEKEINNIPGVIEVGIFATNKPELVIVGKEDGYNLIES